VAAQSLRITVRGSVKAAGNVDKCIDLEVKILRFCRAEGPTLLKLQQVHDQLHVTINAAEHGIG